MSYPVKAKKRRYLASKEQNRPNIKNPTFTQQQEQGSPKEAIKGPPTEKSANTRVVKTGFGVDNPDEGSPQTLVRETGYIKKPDLDQI